MGKVYFASDFHLGIKRGNAVCDRERRIVRWLEQIAGEADAIYLVGDVFDYWFEYREVIPKGFSRLLGTLGRLRDKEIPIYFFTGNHDMWMFRYFEEEYGIPIFREPIVREIGGKRFYLGHGDGLGPGDHGYKFIKKVFANKTCQWLFERIHPNLGLKIMRYWSGKSRNSGEETRQFLGPEKEWLVQHCHEVLDTQEIDYFIFGHRHLPIDYTLKNGKSRYINLGDWIEFNSYAVFDGQDVHLEFFENANGKVYGR